MEFAQLLSALMERNRVTAYKMSADLEISDSLIGYWRRGQKMPGAKNLLKLANYFGVTTDYLLGSPTLRSNIIERLRRQLNLSATQLSAMTDIPNKRLQRIELDFVAPTNDEVMKLAEALGVSSRNLLRRFPAIDQES
ncbi:MAG: helix-turn-helix transcriptional regulator, partial [Lawsonibacter sp.]|nr:helix-turn-helix transcriptional regulator [Lawsonibacter sp.]